MIVAVSAVIAIVAVTVMIACFKATGFFIEVKNLKIKNKEK